MSDAPEPPKGEPAILQDGTLEGAENTMTLLKERTEAFALAHARQEVATLNAKLQEQRAALEEAAARCAKLLERNAVLEGKLQHRSEEPLEATPLESAQVKEDGILPQPQELAALRAKPQEQRAELEEVPMLRAKLQDSLDQRAHLEGQLWHRLEDVAKPSVLQHQGGVEPPGLQGEGEGKDGDEDKNNKKRKETKDSSAEKKEGEDKKDLKHGAFSLTKPRQLYLMVPKQMHLQQNSELIIQKALQTWNLQPPNMLLGFHSGFAHPKHLISADTLSEMDEDGSGGAIFRLLKDLLRHSCMRLCKAKPSLDKTIKEMKSSSDVKDAEDELLRWFIEEAKKVSDEEPKDAQKQHEQEVPDNQKQKDVSEEQEGDRQQREQKVPDNQKKEDPVAKIIGEILEGLNQTLHAELEQMLRSIISTAADANCWILVKGGADGGHVMLEQICDSLDRPPVVLVLDSPYRDRYGYEGKDKYYSKYGYSAKAREELDKALERGQEMTKKLRNNTQPLGAAAEEPFRMPHDLGFWQEKGVKQEWRATSRNFTDAHKIRWSQWMYRSGSHYILTEDPNFWELDLSSLGVTGSIHMNGGRGTLDDVVGCLRRGTPTIILADTGRVCQRFAHIHQQALRWMMGGSIGSSRDDVPEEQPSLPIRRQSVFLSTRGEVGSSGKLGLSTRGEVGSSDKFGRRKQKQPFELQSMWLTETEFDKDVWTPGDAGQLLKLYRDTPHRIARLCAVLSPLTSADRHRMQNHVAMAIGNAMFLPSSDLVEKVDKDCVEQAWAAHAQLLGLAWKERVFADLLALLSAVLTVATQVVAFRSAQTDQMDRLRNRLADQAESLLNSTGVTGVVFNATVEDGWLIPDDLQPILVPILAAVSSLLVAVLLRFQFYFRWAKLIGAAAQLESQIFQFRAHAGNYRLMGPVDDVEGGDAAMRSKNSRELHARQLFKQRCEVILRGVGSLGLRRVVTLTTLTWGNGNAASDREEQIMMLQRQPRHRYLNRLCSRLCCCKREAGSEVVPEALLFEAVSGRHRNGRYRKSKMGDSDQLGCGCLSVDEYFRLRFSPCLHDMEEDVACLGCIVKLGDLISIGLTVASTVFATFGFPFVTAVLVAVEVALQGLKKHFAWLPRLNVAIAAVEDLRCCELEWNSAEPLPKRLPNMLNQIVSSTEHAKLQHVHAATAGSSALNRTSAPE